MTVTIIINILTLRSKTPRWCMQVEAELTRHYAKNHTIIFGEVEDIPNEHFVETEMKSCRDRPPTPVVWNSY